MRLRFLNGETAWRFGYRRRSPKKLASMRETVWRWSSTATAPLSCALPGGSTNCRNWFRGLHPEIVMGKRSGAGREQAGRRPALVLSPRTYNARSGLALVCPITNQAKGYPFEVAVPDGHGATGVVLADPVKSLDWKVRRAEKAGRCTIEAMEEVRARLAPLIGY
jgi:mRNA interferase MazF